MTENRHVVYQNQSQWEHNSLEHIETYFSVRDSPANSHFWGPSGAPMAPFGTLKRVLGCPWLKNMLIVYPNWYMLSLGSILIYNMPIFLHNWQIHILEPLNGSWASLLEPLNGSWASPDWKICINCVPMIYALTGINFDIQHADIPSQLANSHFWGPSGALRAPFGTLKGVLCCPWLKNMCILCLNDLCFHWDRFWYTTCLYLFTISKITFQGPSGALQGPWLRVLE